MSNASGLRLKRQLSNTRNASKMKTIGARSRVSQQKHAAFERDNCFILDAFGNIMRLDASGSTFQKTKIKYDFSLSQLRSELPVLSPSIGVHFT